MMDAQSKDGLLALLAWWREAGVDYALDDASDDWTARPDASPGTGYAWPERERTAEVMPGPAASPPRGAPPAQPFVAAPRVSAPVAAPPKVTPAPIPSARPFATAPPDAAAMAAREAARKATSLEALEATLRSFDGCGLKATAKSLCFYRGSPTASVMIVGEAPGREEDLAGQPFVGPAGRLLDKMLAAIGLDETDVHITNTVYWRPPGNRTPTPQETLVCRPFLERQIGLVQPRLIVTLGGPATKAILAVDDGIMKLRGRWRDAEFDGHTYRVMPTLHPAYLLRTPLAKRQAWRDVLAVKLALADVGRVT